METVQDTQEQPEPQVTITEDGEREGDLELSPKSPMIPEAVTEAAKKGATITDAVAVDATEWLLDSEDDADEPSTKTVWVEIGGGRKVEWVLRALAGEEFKMARRSAMGNREQRRKMVQEGDLSAMDENLYQALVVTQATLRPDLAEAARRKGTHPLGIVQHRFRYKQGVLAEMAGVVNELSGYDPALVQDVVEQAAAGNS